MRWASAVLVGCASAPVSLPSIPPDPCFTFLDEAPGADVYVYDVAWSGRRLVTGGEEHLRAWELDGGQLVALGQHANPEARFNSVVFDDAGRLWVPTGRELREYRLEPVLEPVRSLTISEAELQRADVEGDRLVSCDTDGVLQLVQLDPLRLLDAVDAHRRCTRVDLSDDGRFVLSAGHDGHVVLTEVVGDELVTRQRVALGGEAGEARWGFTNDHAWAGGFDPPFALLELSFDREAASLEVVANHPGHLSGVGTIDRVPGGGAMVEGDHDHTVWWYPVDEADALGEPLLLDDDGLGVHAARVDATGQVLARTASRADRLLLYDVTACRP